MAYTALFLDPIIVSCFNLHHTHFILKFSSSCRRIERYDDVTVCKYNDPDACAAARLQQALQGREGQPRACGGAVQVVGFRRRAAGAAEIRKDTLRLLIFLCQNS